MEAEKLREAIKDIEAGRSFNEAARAHEINSGLLHAAWQGYMLAKQPLNRPSADTWTFDIPHWALVAGPSMIGVIVATLLFFLRR